MTRRRSATPAETAETATKCAFDIEAMIRASVVLPVPGGPQRMHRRQLAGLDEAAQDAPFADEVLLADVLVEAARPHAGGERRVGVERVRLRLRRLAQQARLSGARHGDIVVGAEEGPEFELMGVADGGRGSDGARDRHPSHDGRGALLLVAGSRLHLELDFELELLPAQADEGDAADNQEGQE